MPSFLEFFQFFGMTAIAGCYLCLSAYAANMAPIPAAKVFARWNRPLWEEKLGTNKTLIGTGAGLLAALFVAFAEAELDKRVPFLGNLRPEGVRNVPWPLLGLLLGVGALGGDIIKSIAKRRFGIEPGAPWKPFDDLDFGIGAGIVLIVLITLAREWEALPMIIAGVVIGFVANPIVNRLSHQVGMKAVPY